MEDLNELATNYLKLGIVGAFLLFFGFGLILFFSRQIFKARSLFFEKYIDNNKDSNTKPFKTAIEIKPEDESLADKKARLEKLLKIELSDFYIDLK